MMCKFIFLWVLVYTFCGSQEQQNNVDDALWELFSFSTTPKPANSCECIPYYLCSKNNSIITDGRGLLDLRIDESEPRPCADYMDFCCKLEDIADKPIQPKEVKKPGCGWRNPDGVGFRIIGDSHNEAKFGEFPWMTAILQQDKIGDLDEHLVRYQCGGSLIHPQAVITSAHCINDLNKQYFVRVGEWDTQRKKEIYPSQDREVSSITIHPNYVSEILFNDIAFLYLSSPFNISYPNVGVACLPPQGMVIPSGTRCYATGWGKDVFGNTGLYQVILKKIDVPIVQRSTCLQNLRRTRLGKYFELHESFICAGGEEGKDTCTGDGGSPLMCPIPGQQNQFQQVGIVAWGIGCGEKDVPAAYANVALFRNWIDNQASRYNLDFTYEY